MRGSTFLVLGRGRSSKVLVNIACSIIRWRFMIEKTVFFEKDSAELRYCCTIFWKVATLRGIFEGRCHQLRYCCTRFWKVVTLRCVFGGRFHQLRYCCTNKSENATLRGESIDAPGRLLQKVSLVDVNQEQSDY